MAEAKKADAKGTVKTVKSEKKSVTAKTGNAVTRPSKTKINTEVKTPLYSVSKNRTVSTDKNIEKTFEKVKGRTYSTPQTREAENNAISKAKVGTEIVYKENNSAHDMYETYKKVGKNKWAYNYFEQYGKSYDSRVIDDSQCATNMRNNYHVLDD